jgi:hypothetical protein
MPSISEWEPWTSPFWPERIVGANVQLYRSIYSTFVVTYDAGEPEFYDDFLVAWCRLHELLGEANAKSDT